MSTVAGSRYDYWNAIRQRRYDEIEPEAGRDGALVKLLVDEIENNLRLFHGPNSVVEIRALGIRGRGRPYTAAGYFRDIRIAAAAAVEMERTVNCDGIYFTINPVDPATLYRSPNKLTPYQEPTTSDKDVLCRQWMPVDIDVKRPSGVSTTNEELEDSFSAATLLATGFFPQHGFDAPVLAGSGNGFHLLYAVDLANSNDARDVVAELLKNANHWLTQNFKSTTRPVEVDTTLYNAARVVRLYGTMACKGENSAERPHRRSFLDPDFRFSKPEVVR